MNADTVELAREYDSVSSVYIQNRIRDEALSWIDFEKDDVVLDVGCGSGRLCKLLSPDVYSVTGEYIGHCNMKMFFYNNNNNKVIFI